MRGRPRKYSDRQRFIVSVLWLHGMSEQAIADLVSRYGIVAMTRPAVSCQIGQTPFRGRDKMPVQVRQRFLDTLKANRLDARALPDQFFEVKA
jgi:hypothetical protein